MYISMRVTCECSSWMDEGTRVCMHVCLCVRTYVCMHDCVYVRMRGWMDVRVYVCYMGVWLWMAACMGWLRLVGSLKL